MLDETNSKREASMS